MASPPGAPFDLHGEVTLLELVRLVQDSSRDDGETVRIVSSLLQSGQVRLLSSSARVRCSETGRVGSRIGVWSPRRTRRARLRFA